MDIETKQVETTGNVAVTTDTTVDYKAEYEKSQQAYDKLKLDNAGLDRKIGELSTAQKELLADNEAIKTSKLSDEEKRQLEFDKLKMDFQNERTERTKANNKATALELMNDNGIDKRFINLIPLDNTDAMMEKLNELSLIATDMRQAGAQTVINKLGGNVPTGGIVPTSGRLTTEQYKSLSASDRNKAFNEGRVPISK